MTESRKDRMSKSGTFATSTANRSRKMDAMDLASRKQSRGSSRTVFLQEEKTKAKDRKVELARKKLDDAFVDYITEFSLIHSAFENGSSKWYNLTASNKARFAAISEKADALSGSLKKTERECNKVCGATGDAYNKKKYKTISAMEKAGATSQEMKAKETELSVAHQKVYTHNRDKKIELYEKHTAELEKLTVQLKKMRK
jgi:hypothetical protein